MARRTKRAAATADVTRARVAERTRLGAAIRSLRQLRGRRLADVAADAGVSISLLSQVERGVHDPSLESLRAIAEALDTELLGLLVAGEPRTGIVRRGEAPRLDLPDSDIVYELLSPSMDGALEVTRWELRPGGVSGPRLRAHRGEEATLVLEGSVAIETETERHELAAGDCITLSASVGHRLVALGEARVVGVSVLSPPSF